MAVGHGLVLAGLLYGAWVFLVLAPEFGTFGSDAYAYWSVDLATPYAIPHGMLGSFPYSPPAALAASVFGVLPFWVFLWLWLALAVASLMWMAGTTGWMIVGLAVPAVALELYHGNIHILIAVAVVLGFRHPWTWSFVLLTKATCGVGLLWFAVRREWRQLAVALGATAAISAATFVLLPHLWVDWFGFLAASVGVVATNNDIEVPLLVRLPLAAALVTWGALTDRRWTVVAAVTLALPVLWVTGLAVLIGWLYLVAHPRGTVATRALVRLGLR
jgi:hypothetical protein